MSRETSWIILIEDDAEFARAMSEMLIAQHWGVLVTNKATDAQIKLRNQKFALIVCDMQLERGTGEEVITYIRRDKKELNFTTPVLVVSGHLDVELIKRIRQHIQGVLVKPFDAATFRDKVASMMPAEPAEK